MTSSSLFRVTAILFPVLVALFLSPLPTRSGFYRWLFESIHPGFVGLSPALLPNEADWGFTLSDLYGNGDGDSDGDSNSNSNSNSEVYRNRLVGQTALVTGANSGTGYEVALALARLGVHVTMACRNAARCNAAAESIRSDPTVVERSKSSSASAIVTESVDTSSLKSIRNFCDRFIASSAGAPLDMLFLNAGVGVIGRDADGNLSLSTDGIEMIFATNVVGHHLMYKLLEGPCIREPALPRTTPARVVLTSSSESYRSQHSYLVATDLETLNGVPPLDHNRYPQSKLAQILWAQELTARIDGEGPSPINPNAVVYANSAHPGAVATNIWDKAAWDEFPLGKVFENIALKAKSLMWTSEEGALTLLFLGTAVDRLAAGSIRGQYYHPQSIRVENHPSARDKDLQERLWKFLDELVADYV
eukprot:CAMPEP_0172395562 /NCGR_PEP_ID=MMETSP1061-20121228/20518_1 /TAXON_ID=37318 /ORGANISM="Pseudo-nitzschia pungens, Strain cf. pungens" /LENGTH=418 /DNA_ID=CAMNT_0013127189 /DNA_START=18 /DNA_END=1274 /DNA_ORIENTATION=+